MLVSVILQTYSSVIFVFNLRLKKAILFTQKYYCEVAIIIAIG